MPSLRQTYIRKSWIKPARQCQPTNLFKIDGQWTIVPSFSNLG